VPGKAVGQAAVELPWLCPSTDSLIALADAPAGVLSVAVNDPALEVFLLRFAQPATEPNHFGFAAGALLSAFLPETAAAFLASTSAGVLPESCYVLGLVRRVALRAAEIAVGLAEETRLVPPEPAGRLARLAPLGWYAAAAIDPFDAADPLSDPRFASHALEVQAHVWGLDHAAIARRLAVRWRLPRWVGDTIANLTLPLRLAADLAPHRELFAIVQLAMVEAEAQVGILGLTQGASRAELCDYLRLESAAVERAGTNRREEPVRTGSALDANPHRVSLLPGLLRLAGESRRRNGHGLVSRLEARIDELHEVVKELGEQVGERLRDAKLSGLAELAAGAGHEINNPLAIISSNAQQLLRSESDPNRGESLEAIIRQANRIAGLLRDLMQFARPPAPNRQAFAASELLRAVRAEFESLAVERGVRLEIAEAPAEEWVMGDQHQLRRVLAAVVLNAIQAASSSGWVRVSCQDREGTGIDFVVEDSGGGLTPESAEHAFDPFYSGRTAGRGRGLGLAIAWRLARENGGDLRFDPNAAPVTRFILSVIPALDYDVIKLRSA
jgi:two-component system NtrC family sensor kinase